MLVSIFFSCSVEPCSSNSRQDDEQFSFSYNEEPYTSAASEIRSSFLADTKSTSSNRGDQPSSSTKEMNHSTLNNRNHSSINVEVQYENTSSVDSDSSVFNHEEVVSARIGKYQHSVGVSYFSAYLIQ